MSEPALESRVARLEGVSEEMTPLILKKLDSMSEKLDTISRIDSAQLELSRSIDRAFKEISSVNSQAKTTAESLLEYISIEKGRKKTWGVFFNFLQVGVGAAVGWAFLLLLDVKTDLNTLNTQFEDHIKYLEKSNGHEIRPH